LLLQTATCCTLQKKEHSKFRARQQHPPEHDAAACEGLYTVGPAGVVDEGTQRVQAHTNRAQLIVTHGVVVAGEASYQQRYLPHILSSSTGFGSVWPACCRTCGVRLGLTAVAGLSRLLLLLIALQEAVLHEVPACM
jgi:hypothetical protein